LHRRPEAALEILLELLLELIFQVCGELLAELGLRSLAQPFQRQPNVWLAALGYLLLGGVVGALSVWLLPQHFTGEGWPRLANLVITPVLAGLAMAALGFWRARRGDVLLRIDRFACGYLFALAVAVVRYNFAH
jgi:VIT1/CCC1 family predicted Fe2+/Mn2+ transporter